VKVWNLQHSVLIVKDCKPVLLRQFLLPMFFQYILVLMVHGEWFLRSSKPCVVEGICRFPFSSLFMQCDFQAAAGSGHSKEEDDQFLIYSYFLEVVCVVLSNICTSLCSP
jgi:hypothetical protein